MNIFFLFYFLWMPVLVWYRGKWELILTGFQGLNSNITDSWQRRDGHIKKIVILQKLRKGVCSKNQGYSSLSKHFITAFTVNERTQSCAATLADARCNLLKTLWLQHTVWYSVGRNKKLSLFLVKNSKQGVSPKRESILRQIHLPCLFELHMETVQLMIYSN